jgi:hypothetical protein
MYRTSQLKNLQAVGHARDERKAREREVREARELACVSSSAPRL